MSFHCSELGALILPRLIIFSTSVDTSMTLIKLSPQVIESI